MIDSGTKYNATGMRFWIPANNHAHYGICAKGILLKFWTSSNLYAHQILDTGIAFNQIIDCYISSVGNKISTRTKLN